MSLVNSVDALSASLPTLNAQNSKIKFATDALMVSFTNGIAEIELADTFTYANPIANILSGYAIGNIYAHENTLTVKCAEPVTDQLWIRYIVIGY